MIIGFILILLALISFCIYLYISNKELNKKISKLEQDIKRILEKKVIEEQKEDVIPLEKIKENIKSTPPKTQTKNLKKDNIPNSKEDSFNITDFIQTKNKSASKHLKEEKLIKIDANDETTNFIESLKDFRNNLKS